MQEYHDAKLGVLRAKYTSLRHSLDQGGGTRESVLEWLGQYTVFVGKSMSTLLQTPDSAFQLAINQVPSRLRVLFPRRSALLSLRCGP